MSARYRREPNFASLNLRHPQLEGGDFVFGPGGQAAIVPAQDTPPPSQQGVSPQAQLQNGQPSSDVSQQTPISQLGSSTLSLPQLSQSVLQASLSPTTTPLLQASLSPPVTTSLTTSAAIFSTAPPLSPTVSTFSPPETETETTPTSTILTTSSSLPVTSVTIGLVPTNTSSDSEDESNHGVPFYVGIVLGTIVVVACVAALIAWWIRLRAHSKRRHEFAATHVPWGKHSGDDGLEEARDTGFVGGLVTIDGIVHRDSLHSWEPSGDRDVGEPKRTYSFLHSPISPVKRAAAPFTENFYQPGVPNASHGQVSQLPDSVAYPLPFVNEPHSPARPLPHHLGSVNSTVHGSAHALGPLQVANLMPGDVSSSRPATVLGMADSRNVMEFGTPREVVPGSRPRFWGLEGNGLSVPWAPLRLGSKRFGNAKGEGGHSWEHLPPLPLPMPGETDLKSEVGTEGWTASLRANLVNAFNSVSSNLTAGSSASGDNLTPVPQRRSQRRSPHDAGWAEHVGGQLVGRPLKREITTYSSSSQLSKTWTLEETGEGTGIVHIRSLDDYYGGPHAWSHPVSLYFGSDDGSDGKTIQSSTTITSQTPLTLMKKPQAALLKPNPRNQLYPHSIGNVSRASSVYSTASAAPSAFSFHSRPQQLSSRNTMRSRGGKRTGMNRSSKQGRVQPGNVSRISSSNCSMASSGSAASSLGMEPALKDRFGGKGPGRLGPKKNGMRS